MIESLLNSLAGPMAGAISKQTGIPEGLVKTGVTAGLPLLMGALARNAKKEDEGDALMGAIKRDHDGQVLGDLEGYVQRGGDIDDGRGILKHTLGDRQDTAVRALAEKTGMSMEQAAQLLPMLSPLVMGAIGREQREQGLDRQQLAARLEREQREVAERDEGGLGGMAALLDRDGDGDIMDDLGDLAGLASKFLNR